MYDLSEGKLNRCKRKYRLCFLICQKIFWLLEFILHNIYYALEIIIRIILQILEFYGIIILTNILLEFNIIFTCSLIKKNLLIILSFLFNIIFGYISSNILTILYYEFSQLSWIKNDTINQSIKISILKDENKNESSEKDDYKTNYESIITMLLIILFLFGKSEITEIAYALIFTHLPFIKILTIFTAVLFYKSKKILVVKVKCPYFKLKDFSAKRYSLFYKMTNNNNKSNIIKLILIIICFLLNVIIIVCKKESYWSIFFVFFVYLLCGSFFIFLQIEPWFFYLETLNRCINEDYFYSDSTIFEENKTLKKCNKIVTMLYFIIFLLWILTGLDLYNQDPNNKYTIQNYFNKTKNFTGFHWLKKNNNSAHDIVSSICYSKINYLNYIQLSGLASAAYLEGEINKEQNIIDAFKLSIFNELDNNIKFKNLSFITTNSDIITILKADFMTNRNKPFTILSIKGTSNYLDFFLDVEMFMTSAFYTLGAKIPILYKSESYFSYYFTHYSLLSFNCLGGLTLTKEYVDKIDSKFNELINTPGYGLNEREYLLIGHSLGGGLAKLIAFKYKIQSFSVSGPGLTPLEFYLGFGKNESKKYFKSTFIDVIPDLDIVPRVDLSGGSQYRVLCEKGIFKCHEIKRTLCMLGVMCNKEHLTGDLCSGIYSNKEYEEDFTKVESDKY